MEDIFHKDFVLCFTYLFFIEYTCFTVLLLSSVQQSKSAIHIHISPLYIPLFAFRSPPDFPGVSHSKESSCNTGDLGSIPGLGRSLQGRHGNPLQYSCLENPHGQRSLVGYSPWGQKKSDTTERQSIAQHSRSTHWVDFHVVYNRFSLVVYFIHSTVCMSIPISHFILPHLPPPESLHLSIHLCLYFCFANKFICIRFLDSTYMH